MMKMGAMATINQVIDQETAALVAEEMGHKVVLRKENELEEAILSDRDNTTEATPRAPVVTIMGTLTTVKHRRLITFVVAVLHQVKRVVLLNISVLTTLKPKTV